MEYNVRSETSKYIYPDGTEIERTYTERGQLHQVKFNGTTQDTITYDDGGRMVTSTYANGVMTSRSYNNDNTLSLIDFGGTSGGNNIGDLSYTWDANKNKTSESIAGTMSGYSFTVPTSGYDKEDRLVSYDGAANQPDQSWNLSLVGEWDSVTTDGTTQNRTHGPTHELLTADGQNVVQDAKGNMTTIPANLRKSNSVLNLTWDFDNRMSGADIDGDGTTDVTYQFDALGRRVGRIQGTYRRVYPHVGQQTVADYTRTNGSIHPNFRYVWGSCIDEPIVRLNPNGSRVYYHQNQQYSTYALTNATGQIIERYAYTAYGEQKVFAYTGASRQKSTYAIRHTYTGREWDSAIGLYHFRARMYDPISGRFYSRDPIGYVDGMSLHRAYFVPGTVDPFGYAKWYWTQTLVSKHRIKYNPAMTKKNHGAPVIHLPGKAGIYSGAAAADLTLGAKQGRGLNTFIVDHYFKGKGKDLDLTFSSVIESEVMAALTPKHQLHWGSINAQAEAFKCKKFGVNFIGDKAFTPIARVGFRSSIWVIRSANTGLQKKCTATVVCLCNKPGKELRVAVITCRFKNYFYDQFADAADIPHKIGGA